MKAATGLRPPAGAAARRDADHLSSRPARRAGGRRVFTHCRSARSRRAGCCRPRRRRDVPAADFVIGRRHRQSTCGSRSSAARQATPSAGCSAANQEIVARYTPGAVAECAVACAAACVVFCSETDDESMCRRSSTELCDLKNCQTNIVERRRSLRTQKAWKVVQPGTKSRHTSLSDDGEGRTEGRTSIAATQPVDMAHREDHRQRPTAACRRRDGSQHRDGEQARRRCARRNRAVPVRRSARRRRSPKVRPT